MILFKNSRYLLRLLFSKGDLGFVFRRCSFVKGGFFRLVKCCFTIVEKFAFFKLNFFLQIF